MADRAKTASFEYLDTVPAVEQFTTEIADVTELALDTEGASFHRFVDRIYLLQLSTRTRHAVIDPLPIGRPVVQLRIASAVQRPSAQRLRPAAESATPRIPASGSKSAES